MNPAGFVLERRFSDSDDLACAVRDWDLDFRQLDAGQVEARLGHVATPGVLMTECALSRRVEQKGTPPPGTWTFAVPVYDQMTLRWRREEHTGESLMVFQPESELDAVSDAGFHVFTISIAESYLAEAAARRGVDSFVRLNLGSGVLQCPREVRQRLRQLARSLMEAAIALPGVLADNGYRRALEEDLVEAILDALIEASPLEKRPMARTRTRALRKAKEIIADRAGDPVSIAELEKLSGCSTRTLQYAFAESFGLSPKQYLQAYRLTEVRRLLRQGSAPGVTVAECAGALGFWHMGQFARDYRRMFGELPSETLR